MSPKFIHFNRGKRSIAVDLKTAAGKAVLARLAEQADVLVTNMRGGALERLGITWEALRPRNPRLVFCVIAGFGSRGRHHDSPAYDTIIQGMSGFAAALGRVTGEPRYAPFVLCDHITGIIAGAGHHRRAVRPRAQTGRGPGDRGADVREHGAFRPDRAHVQAHLRPRGRRPATRG